MTLIGRKAKTTIAISVSPAVRATLSCSRGVGQIVGEESGLQRRLVQQETRSKRQRKSAVVAWVEEERGMKKVLKKKEERTILSTTILFMTTRIILSLSGIGIFSRSYAKTENGDPGAYPLSKVSSKNQSTIRK